MKRQLTYIVVNLLYAAGVIVATIVRPEAGIHPLYLVLLFALCSSPVLFMRRWNDRFVVLAVFCGFYFVMYGLLDTVNLAVAVAQPSLSGAHAAVPGPISDAELLILVGGLVTQLGYGVACRAASRRVDTSERDWPESSLVVVGGLLWVISTWLTWRYEVYVVGGLDTEGDRGLEGLSQFQALIYMIATYLQPLGIVFLAYAQCLYRRRYLMVLVVAAIIVEMMLGFVADMKGEVFLGLILVLLTKFLIGGRVPKVRAAILLVAIAALFPILQANRVVRGEYNINHAQAAQAIIEVFKRALTEKSAASSGPERAQSFVERSSLKGSVDLIVTHTGHDVSFQNGYTFIPMLTAFIPRILWPNKPDVETGRVMNRVFLIAPDQPGTYISPSHLGEFYWNFGWPGSVLGMSLVGLLFGYVGARCDLSKSVTLTRLLFVIVTIKLLVLGQESSIATQYTMWLRSMVAVWLMHLAFARVRVDNVRRIGEPTPPEDLALADSAGAAVPLPFANLMR